MFNLWRAAQFTGGVDVQVLNPSLPGVADIVSQGEPVLLSYLVAATMIVDLADRQLLLAEPDAAARLAAERVMLARETTMLRTLPSTPATDLRNSPYSPN